MIATARINPGTNSSVWEFPSKLPLESKIEIHNTNDPNFPYEIRLIALKETSPQDLQVRNLFVKAVVENHTKNQSFRVILGNNGSGLGLSLTARTDGMMVSNSGKVNRDITTQIVVEKTDALQFVVAKRKAEGCWANAKIFLNTCWSRLCAWLGNLIGIFIRK